MVITMTMRNTDLPISFAATPRTAYHCGLHAACPAGNRQPNLKEEKDFDKYEGKRPGCSRHSLLKVAALRKMACWASGATAKMESARTEKRNKGNLALRK
jgi:hypothetical protein